MIADVDVLLMAALLALPLSAVAVLIAVVLVIVCRHPWPAVVCAVLAAALGVVWVALTYRDAVRADENGGGGNIFSQVGWLAAAVITAAVALRVQWTHLRRPASTSRAGRSAGRSAGGSAGRSANGTGSISSRVGSSTDTGGDRGQHDGAPKLDAVHD